jgi:hypothetical protein
LAIAAVRAPQVPEWRVTHALTDAAKADVLALATRLQLGRPAIVISEVIHQPLGCQALRIESEAAITGSRRTWQRLWVTQASLKCPLVQPDSPRVGDWIVAEPKREVGAWRVGLGAGFLDVETPSTISYAEVVAIVEAIRSGRLVNRLPPEYLGKNRQIPKVDAAAIYSVWNAHLDPALYAVRFRTTNIVLVVAVRGSTVELRGWNTEIA